MKKILFSVFSLLVFVGLANAQEDPAKALKKAKTLLVAYNTNPGENIAKLTEAKEKIDLAMADEAIQGTFKGWSTKGDIYNTMASVDVTEYFRMAALAEADGFTFQYPGTAMVAYEAIKMGLSKAVKKYETKEMLKQLQSVNNNLAQIGNIFLEKKNYGNAYNSLNSVLEIHDILEENGVETILQAEEEYNNHAYVVGYCAMAAKQNDRASDLFQKLIEAKYEEPSLYAHMFNLNKEANEEKALKYLTEGRETYPDNKEILFAEINYYIGKEDFKTLRGKLAKAIEADPNNPSVYSALGNVYMNLFQQEFAAGNNSVADEYFNSSKEYYEKALALDDSLFDVQYSIGSLYYNKAVEVTKVMNELPVNEAKKYEALNAQAKEFFGTALPYFKKAESMNASDMNTLIALKEIFARLDDFEKSGEFKARLEQVQAGAKIEKSYF